MAVTTIGKIRVLEFLEGELNYLALNNSGGEYYRKPISDEFIDGDTLIVDTFFETSEGNEANITQIDLVMNGTATTDSGENFAEEPVTLSKDVSETMTISVEIQMLEV